MMLPEKFELSLSLVQDIINVLNAYKTLSPSPVVAAVLARLDSEIKDKLNTAPKTE